MRANHPHEGSGDRWTSPGRRRAVEPTIPMRGQESMVRHLVAVGAEANHPHEGSGVLLAELARRLRDGPTIPMRGQEHVRQRRLPDMQPSQPSP